MCTGKEIDCKGYIRWGLGGLQGRSEIAVVDAMSGRVITMIMLEGIDPKKLEGRVLRIDMQLDPALRKVLDHGNSLTQEEFLRQGNCSELSEPLSLSDGYD